MLVCFAVSCDSGIATHSLSMCCSQKAFFYCHCCFNEGARAGAQKLFPLLGLIILFANLQMVVNKGRALHYTVAFLQVYAGYPAVMAKLQGRK